MNCRDAFADCIEVEYHVGAVEWMVGLGPSQHPSYVRLALGDSDAVDLSSTAAAGLAGHLIQPVESLRLALGGGDPVDLPRPEASELARALSLRAAELVP